MENGVVLALIGLGEAILTSVVTFLLTRRRYKTEVDSNEIDNKHKDLKFYMDLVEDNLKRLDELQDENRGLRREVAEMRSVMFGMLSQICTDMMCQKRTFDKDTCPYYEQLFNLRKDGAETE